MNGGQTIYGNWKDRLRKNAERDTGSITICLLYEGLGRLPCDCCYTSGTISHKKDDGEHFLVEGGVGRRHSPRAYRGGAEWEKGQQNLREKMAAQWEELWR